MNHWCHQIQMNWIEHNQFSYHVLYVAHNLNHNQDQADHSQQFNLIRQLGNLAGDKHRRTAGHNNQQRADYHDSQIIAEFSAPGPIFLDFPDII